MLELNIQITRINEMYPQLYYLVLFLDTRSKSFKVICILLSEDM